MQRKDFETVGFHLQHKHQAPLVILQITSEYCSSYTFMCYMMTGSLLKAVEPLSTSKTRLFIL